MSVKAKFRCYGKQKEKFSDGSEGYTILLDAVYDPDPNSENGRFFKLTPAGQIRLGTINAQAADQFEQGQEYYVDFTRVK